MKTSKSKVIGRAAIFQHIVSAIAATALALAAFFGCMATRPASAGRDGKTYSVAMLGDIHYDANCFHKGGKAGYKAAMWKDELPAILNASSNLVGRDTAFALQLGDLIDGTQLGYDSHTQMLAEATAVLTGTYRGIPAISVCGNHDIVGAGWKGYNDVMLPWLNSQVFAFDTNVLKTSTFGFRNGPDLWIVINFNSAGSTVPIVEKLLADNPDVRYTFIAIHGPVLPMDVWKCRWFYLGSEKHNDLRRKVRALLARRNAIVLAGHVHSLEHKDWFGDGGRITEVVVNSVPRSGSGNPKPAIPDVISETPADYGTWLKEAETNEANAAFEALYEEYRPGLKTRYAASAVGHHVLRVSDSGVTLEYYGRDATSPTKVFRLR